jgi:hypothetical protein
MNSLIEWLKDRLRENPLLGSLLGLGVGLLVAVVIKACLRADREEIEEVAYGEGVQDGFNKAAKSLIVKAIDDKNLRETAAVPPLAPTAAADPASENK